MIIGALLIGCAVGIILYCIVDYIWRERNAGK